MRPRWPTVVVSLISAPFVAATVAGAAYIGYSLVVESWYRDMFGDYATMLLVSYVFYALGIAFTARLAAPRAAPLAPRPRLFAVAMCIAGLVAAGVLESVFWPDEDRLLPRGILFLPFAAWALLAMMSGRQQARR